MACEGTCSVDHNGTANCDSCGDNCYCEIPQSLPEPGKLAKVDCLTYSDEDFLSKSEAGSLAPFTFIFLKVPVVSNPGKFKSILIPVGTPVPIKISGWQAFFIPSSGPSTPVVFPATLPTDITQNTDKVLTAGVTLIGAAGQTQYWVPVMERFRWAILQVSGLTVFLFRDPLP